MSYIGANKIGGMHLGSTTIAKAYLGSDLVYQKSGVTPPLPYDAELEYLESSGTQYIDTLFKPNKDTKMDVVYMFRSYSTLIPFGVRDSGDAYDAKNGIFRTNMRSYGRVAFGNGTGTNTNVYVGNSYFNVYDIFFDKNEVYLDGNLVTTIPYSDWQSNYNIYLFGVNTGGTFGYSNSNVVIYSCKIWDDNTLVRDFIPVRIGTVGYMYDQVSKMFFGNAGSGDFILGNDKN